MASALLDIVFPRGYDNDEPLTGPQRLVIGAIAASSNAWTFNVNLAEVLRYNVLPDDRQGLRALLGQVEASSRTSDGNQPTGQHDPR